MLNADSGVCLDGNQACRVCTDIFVKRKAQAFVLSDYLVPLRGIDLEISILVSVPEVKDLQPCVQCSFV